MFFLDQVGLFGHPAVYTKENIGFWSFWQPRKTWIGRSDLLQSGKRG
jgi:hypothetical protein